MVGADGASVLVLNSPEDERAGSFGPVAGAGVAVGGRGTNLTSVGSGTFIDANGSAALDGIGFVTPERDEGRGRLARGNRWVLGFGSGLGLSVGSDLGLGFGASFGAVVLRKSGDLPGMARRAADLVVSFGVDLGLGGGGTVARGWTWTGATTEVVGGTTVVGVALVLRLGLAFLAGALAIDAGGVVLGAAAESGGAIFGAGSGADAAF